MFTPLCFMCSPKLLNPECGKKIGLLQVVKKSVSPKISASKVDKLSYTSLPIPVVPKISNTKPPNPSTLDRTILPLVVQTTVVTSSPPSSGAIASTTMWGTKAGSPEFNFDLAPTDSAAPPHSRETNVSQSFKKGLPLFGKGHTSSILRQARNGKLPRRPETSADQTQTRTSGPSLRSPSNTEHLRPATAEPRTAPYLPHSTIERPGRQGRQSSTLNPDPQSTNNAVSLVNSHDLPVNMLPSPLKMSSPTASPEQIRKWMSETSSRNFPPSRAPQPSPLSIPSRPSTDPSLSSHTISRSAYRGTVSPPSSTPIVDATKRPPLPVPPRPRRPCDQRIQEASTTNGR
ncbi:hypothetical protein BS47DRAFT_1338187 [Hydnum rufescens UP504]|uniref:Uncharacterized protein n=1 Tax=Hydnum rufescens UP504 TaxID=1448309 RepID=A0A9P6B756_9AGAM|nr:hypothetical protein BS47DRAFT_1338187 [Hydnum rufescens UP504]